MSCISGKGWQTVNCSCTYRTENFYHTIIWTELYARCLILPSCAGITLKWPSHNRMQYKFVKSTNLSRIYIVTNMTTAGQRFGKHVPAATNRHGINTRCYESRPVHYKAQSRDNSQAADILCGYRQEPYRDESCSRKSVTIHFIRKSFIQS
jgi:hypothetical protein